MTAAAMVALCKCGHAGRMHERDDAEPDGRGACLQGHCGCSGMRAGEAIDVPPTPEPAASEPVENPEPPPTPSTAPAKSTWRCDPCGVDFERPQALGAHNRYKHSDRPVNTRPDVHPEGLPAAAKQGSPGQDGSSAAVSSVRPDNGARPAPSGTATTGEADAEPREMRPAAGLGAFAASARYSLTAAFVMPNDAGNVEVHLTDATEAQLLDLLPLITNLPADRS